MRRRGVEVVVELLDVLAVVALGVGQAEQPLLEDRVAAVPQRQGEAEQALGVADAGDAVLAPAIGPAAGVVVREVVPGLAVRAVVLAHRAPLPLAEVRPPAPPGMLRATGFLQALCSAFMTPILGTVFGTLSATISYPTKIMHITYIVARHYQILPYKPCFSNICIEIFVAS